MTDCKLCSIHVDTQAKLSARNAGGAVLKRTCLANPLNYVSRRMRCSGNSFEVKRL
jgi:hypothetical protein